MIKLTGILACDPGWRGLSFTLYVPSLDYTSTRLFRLNYTKNKSYKRPVNTIPLLVEQIKNIYWKEEPRLQFVDKIILESQHKLNMQQLSWSIHAVLLTLMPHAKVEYISPLKCKRLFKIPLGENWKENKDRMLEYVITHKNELIAGDTVTTHDTADSIILLNTFFKEKKRRVCTEVITTTTMSSHKITCPQCNNPTGAVKQCQKPPNAGKYFLTCANYKDGNKCGFKWLDYDEPEPITGDDGNEYIDPGMEWAIAGEAPKTTGVKRKWAPKIATKRQQPPSKVAANSATPIDHSLIRDIKKIHEEFLRRLPDIINTIIDSRTSSGTSEDDKIEQQDE